MKKNLKTKVNKALSLKHIALVGGNISLACKNSGLSRTQIYKWRLDDSDYNTKFLNVIKNIEKFSDSMLLKKALMDDTKALIALSKKTERQRIYTAKCLIKK